MSEYKSLNDIVFNYAISFNEIQELVSSRNDDTLGQVKEMINESITLSNPKARHLYLYGRKNNPFATWAETLWVLGGTPRLNPVMTAFLPRCTQFSDDGETWRGAYNLRISYHNLLQHVIDMYKEDSINTRRACFSIWSPEFDSYGAVQEQLGGRKTKDMPCSNFVWTWVRDNKFNLKLGMRSNDLIWGLSNINIFEFTFIQEVLLRFLKRDLIEFQDVELGDYIHNPVSLHVYQATYPQIESIVNNSEQNETLLDPLSTYDIKITSNKEVFIKCFFKSLYNFFEDEVVKINRITSVENIIVDTNKYFLDNNIPIENNILYLYTIFPLLYLQSDKLHEITISDFLNMLDEHDISIPDDIYQCLTIRYSE